MPREIHPYYTAGKIGRVTATRTPLTEGGVNQVYRLITAQYPPLQNMSDAACKGKDGEYWGEVPQTNHVLKLPPSTEYALKVCSTCPVQAMCAQQWVDDGRPAGVYAGQLVTSVRDHSVGVSYMDVLDDPSLTPPPVLPGSRRIVVPFREPVQRDVCGTQEGIEAHKASLEVQCKRCRNHRKNRGAPRSRVHQVVERPTAPHGTRAARQRHTRRGEAYCEACLRPVLREEPKMRRGSQKPLPAATVNRIHVMRSKGFSAERIADELNMAGVPTASRTGGWHPKSVRLVLAARTNDLAA